MNRLVVLLACSLLSVQLQAVEFLVLAAGPDRGKIVSYKSEDSPSWGRRETFPVFVKIAVDGISNPAYYVSPVFNADGIIIKERPYNIKQSTIDTLITDQMECLSVTKEAFGGLLE